MKLTIKPSGGAHQLLFPSCQIPSLPKRPHAINLRMMKIKRRISRTDEQIIIHPANGEMSAWVQAWVSESLRKIGKIDSINYGRLDFSVVEVLE